MFADNSLTIHFIISLAIYLVSGWSRGSASEAVPNGHFGRTALHRAFDRLSRVESEREMVRSHVTLVDQWLACSIRDTEVW